MVMTDEFKGYPIEDLIWFNPEDLEKHDKEIAEQIIEDIPDEITFINILGYDDIGYLEKLKDQLRKKYL